MTHTDGMQSNTPGINTQIYQRISEQDQLESKTCEYSDHNLQDLEHDIDPDNNFFLNINNDNNICCYYTDYQYNRNITSKGKLSIAEVCMQTSIISRNVSLNSHNHST